MLALTGMAAGLFGDLMMLILFTVQHLAFGYHTGTLESGVEHASDTRRLVVLLVAGAFGGISWFLLRRCTRGEKSELDDVVWGDGARLSFRRSLGTSVISEIVIGMGASIGREAAPKLMGGASAGILAGWARLSPAQRRLLMACGGGAGLAAVYNVPLGGALFTAEVMMGSISLPIVLPALACSGIATVTGWLYLPSRATYLDVPGYHVTVPLLTWALLRPADRGDRVRIHPADRLGIPSPGPWPVGADRSGGCLRGSRPHRIRLPAAFRQREGHGSRCLPGLGRPGPAGGPVRTQAAGHGAVPGQRCVRGPVHADAEHRRGAGRRGRYRVEPALAGSPAARTRWWGRRRCWERPCRRRWPGWR